MARIVVTFVDDKAKSTVLFDEPVSPRPSGSGKSTVLATTSGNRPTVAQYAGKPIVLGLNAYTSK